MKFFTIVLVNFLLLGCNSIPYQELHFKAIVVDIDSGDRIDVYLQAEQPFPIIVRIKELVLVEQQFIPGVMENLQTNWVYSSSANQRKNGKVRLFSIKDSNKGFFYTWNTIVGIIEAKHDDKYIYQLPYPTGGPGYKIIQGYNGQFSHKGVYALDFQMPKGSPITAARSGIIVQIQDNYSKGGTLKVYENRDNFIHILHDDNTSGIYAHFMHKGIVVQIGEEVAAGQLLGYAGNTGYSSEAHLHFLVATYSQNFERQSFATKFRTSDGILELKENQIYSH